MKRLRNIITALVVAVTTLGAVAGTFDLSRAFSAISKGAQALTLTNSQLVSYVSQAVTQMDAQAKIAPASSAYTKRLANLTNGINAVGSTPLNFKVYMTDEINAFACADGSVRVYSGIMDIMDDDELLGIIGHEIGHVGMEHSKNALKQQLLNEAILEGAASANSTIATLTDSQLAAIGSALMSARYSRKQENQADDYGYDFLKKCGKNPYAMVEAFEKMQQLEGSASAGSSVSSYFNKMFSDHPETAKRIKRMKDRCKKDGFTK